MGANVLVADSFAESLTAHLDRVTRRRRHLGPPQVLVRAPGIEFSHGPRETPFHGASIGKAATAALVMQLRDEGALSLGSHAADLLPAGTLDGLFAVDGVNRAGEVTVEQLLTHTSGVADYFEGRTTGGPRLLDLMLAEPDRFWEPEDLVEFTRTRQRPVGRPGERFSYSDTGYILLGMLLEHVTGQSFHELLHERIFGPVGMRDSYLMFHSEPAAGARPLAPLHLGRVEASGFTSLSCDWAGGGIVSTLDDLARFSAALHGGELVSPGSLAEMARMRHRFRRGIHYGAGLMEVRFEGFFPLLRGLPRPVGHIGILGTHMFFDPVNRAHIVMNFGGTREMVRSFQTLIRIETLLTRGS